MVFPDWRLRLLHVLFPRATTLSIEPLDFGTVAFKIRHDMIPFPRWRNLQHVRLFGNINKLSQSLLTDYCKTIIAKSSRSLRTLHLDYFELRSQDLENMKKLSKLEKLVLRHCWLPQERIELKSKLTDLELFSCNLFRTKTFCISNFYKIYHNLLTNDK